MDGDEAHRSGWATAAEIGGGGNSAVAWMHGRRGSMEQRRVCGVIGLAGGGWTVVGDGEPLDDGKLAGEGAHAVVMAVSFLHGWRHGMEGDVRCLKAVVTSSWGHGGIGWRISVKGSGESREREAIAEWRKKK
jgi:hypothetical protein